MQNIPSLLRQLNIYSDFFTKYKEHYITIFIEEIEETKTKITPLLTQRSVRTIAEKLYILFFLCKYDPLHELTDFSYKAAQNGIDIKSACIKANLNLLRDFIDFILEKKANFSSVKLLIALIDIYTVTIDKVYAKYYQEIKNSFDRIKRKEEKDERDIIFSLLQQVRESKKGVILLNYFDQVPISCKDIPIIALNNNKVILKIEECNYNIFSESGTIYIRIDFFPKVIEATIDKYEKFRYIVIHQLHFTELPQEHRKYVRVQPKEQITISITDNTTIVVGIIVDISIGGVGVYSSEIDKLAPQKRVTLNFELAGKSVTIEGIVRYCLPETKKCGIEFILNNEIENILSQYVLERQFEIIKKVRL